MLLFNAIYSSTNFDCPILLSHLSGNIQQSLNLNIRSSISFLLMFAELSERNGKETLNKITQITCIIFL